jgi:hypothetical protein
MTFGCSVCRGFMVVLYLGCAETGIAVWLCPDSAVGVAAVVAQPLAKAIKALTRNSCVFISSSQKTGNCYSDKSNDLTVAFS